MSAYIIANLRAVLTTPAQHAAHPLRIMTLNGKFFEATPAADGTYSAGSLQTRKSLVVTSGPEYKTNPDGTIVQVGADASAEGFSLDFASGVLTTAGGQRGRPTSAGADAATVSALLSAARSVAPDVADDAPDEPEDEPAAPKRSKATREA